MEFRRLNFTGRQTWDVPMKLDPMPKLQEEKHSADCVLELACFVKPPILSFDNVKIGGTKTRRLKILNPGAEAEIIELEKFPLKETGFVINDGLQDGDTLRIILEPQHEISLPIKWQPNVARNSRHVLVFKWIGGQKLQVVILASAIDPDAGKKKRVKRKPIRKSLQPTDRTNIPTKNVVKDRLYKETTQKPSTPERQPNSNNLVEILPDTPSRRQTFTVVHSNVKNQTMPRYSDGHEDKENIGVNNQPVVDDRGTFNIVNKEVDEVDNRRCSKSSTNNDVLATDNNETFVPQPESFADTTSFDSNTFHESEIRLSSSPIKVSSNSGSLPMMKGRSDLNPGQVVMNGEVKHQFIPYPSFNNTDTFWNIEMSTAAKPNQGYDDSLSFSSAASSLFTLTRDEKFSPHLETVDETTVNRTPKSDTATTITNENCSATSSRDVSADETLRASDNDDKILEKSLSLGNQTTDNCECLATVFSQDLMLSAKKSEHALIPNLDFNDANESLPDAVCQMIPGFPLSHTVSVDQSLNPDVIDVVDHSKCDTSKKPSKPDISPRSSSKSFIVKSTKSAPMRKSAVCRRSLPALPAGESKLSSQAKEQAAKVPRKTNSKVVESRYLASQGKDKTEETKRKVESKPGIKRPANVVDAKFKSLTSTKKMKSDTEPLKGMVKPRLAMTKLKLIKPKAAMPRHPMPYAARNMFYDERWIEKQERGFKNWLNFVLTSPEDEECPEEELRKGSITLDSQSSQPIAPTKEVLSFRMYAARRRMARLRRAACIHYQSDQLASTICKIEREIEHGRLALRSDRQVGADLGVRRHIADMLLSFNPLWLRIGLEVVYGEIIPMHSNNDVSSLSRFIQRRLLGNPDIAADYSHPSVPGLFRPGYVEMLAKFTLKKLLLVIIFLDSAKNSRLVSHDPCLFKKDSEFKATRDMLLCFSRNYLHREGDLVKHLSYLGYTVSHVQTPLQEFDFGVTNLSVDLRDGLRLVRVVELLTKNWNLSSRLRVPAVSRMQKVHNVGVALQGLLDSVFAESGFNFDAKSIVDGHREKTLLLLWQIIFNFQVELLLDEEKLKDEIRHLEKSKQLKIDSEQLEHFQSTPHQKRKSLDAAVYFKSSKLSLLLKWCRLVCGLHGVKVENFTVSFSDGRALCYLLHHYHPALLPNDSIQKETSVTCGLSLDADQDVDDALVYQNWTQCFSPSTGVNRKLEKLLQNEKHNFAVFSDKVKEIGGGPVMISASDMSNTIPDEKVVIAFLSFLCSRLLDIREEIRAARCIQVAWRRYHLSRQKQKLKALTAAAVKLQALVRGYLLRKDMKKREIACVKIQACWRGFAVRKQIKEEDDTKYRAKQDTAALKIQTVFRGYLHRQKLQCQKDSVIILQKAIRRYLFNKRQALRNAAAAKIQRRYREWKLAVNERTLFLRKRSAAITIQQALRKHIQAGNEQKCQMATRIQSTWRMHKCRQELIRKRQCATLIQKSFKGYSARQDFLQKRHAVIVLQDRFRAWRLARSVRSDYIGRRNAVVKIQANARMKLQRNRYNKLRTSVVLIQSIVRKKIARQRYMLLRKAAIVIQRRFRAIKLGRSIRRDFHNLKAACVIVQSRFRGMQCEKAYTRLRSTAVKMQALYRGKKCREHYLKLKASTLCIQQRYRAVALGKMVRKEFERTRVACITIQATYKGAQEKKKYCSLKKHVTRMQQLFKGRKASRDYLCLRTAVVNMQRRYRAKVMGSETLREYTKKKTACITIQSWYRCKTAQRNYCRLRQAVICIQSNVRRIIAFRRYQKLQSATLCIQRRYRALRLGQATQIHYLITKAASLTIQAHYRGYRVRRELKKQHHAAIKIQAVTRMYLARQKYMKLKSAAVSMQVRYRASRLCKQVSGDYKAMKHSTVVLQAAYRGHLVRKQLRLQHQAAVKIQATVRMYLGRQKYLKLKSAVSCIQLRYRASRLGKQATAEYQRLRRSVIKLQAAYRGYYVRKQLRREHQAATEIQANVRKYLARQKFMKLKSAVICMQMRYRASRLCKQASNDYKALRQSAITLQAMYRGYLIRKELKRQQIAAIKIQATARMYSAKQEFVKLKSAVIKMQLRYKASVLCKKASSDYRALKKSAIKLQAVYRGHLVRKQLKEKSAAATKIQALYKAHVARNRFEKMREAAIAIQARYRGYRVRKNYKEKISSAVKIQRYYRGYEKTKKAVDEYQKTRASAVKIQSLYRCHKQRMAFMRLRESVIAVQRTWRKHLMKKMQNAAAITLQSRWRAYQLGKQDRALYATKKNACILIQTAFRRHVETKKYAKMRASVLVIQRRFVAHKSMLVQRRAYETSKKSAVLIQATYRMYVICKAYIIKKSAAITIQRALRLHLARKQQIKEMKAACVIQRHWTAYKAMVKCRTEYQQRRQAVITLQSAFRGLSAREKFKRMKRSVVLIQSLCRMMIAKRKFTKQKKAAVLIQQHFRAYVLGTLEAANFHVTRGAIITLQAVARGFIVRKRYRQQLKSLIRLQATIRMLICRRKYQQLREVTVRMQQRVRSNIRCAEMRKEYLQKKAACSTIQRRYRRYREVKQSVIKMQALFRMKKELSAFVQKKSACVKIQNAFRSYRHRKVAATRIQSIWRMNCARNEFLTKKNACIKIQATVRRFQAQQQYLLYQGAALVIQRRYEAYVIGSLERLRFLDKKYACVRIQALFRMVICRRNYQRMRESVITIQRRYQAQVAMIKERSRFVTVKSAVVKIQAVYRGYQGRCFVAKLREQKMIEEYMKIVKAQQQLLRQISAAIAIQKNYRALMERRRYLCIRNSVIRIQKLYRSRRRMVETRDNYLRQKQSALTIQNAYRMYKARRMLQELKAEKDLKNHSALVIQKNYRALVERRNYVCLRVSTIKIQKAFRSHRLMLTTRDDFLRQKQSVVTIQNAYRIYKAKQIVQELKTARDLENYSAIVIQRNFRRLVAQKEFSIKKQAAMKIQSWFKGCLLTEQLRKDFAIKKHSAVKIQSAYRVYKSRRIVKSLREEKKTRMVAAVKIQACLKGYIQRRRFLLLRQAAVNIQVVYRSAQNAKAIRSEFLAKRESSITIQTAYRGYRARKLLKVLKMEKARLETIVVQMQRRRRALTTMRQQRASFLRMKMATIVIQRAFRLKLGKKALVKKEAATAIQRCYRAYREKKMAKYHHAAVKIQSCFRRYSQTAKYEELKRATLLIQRRIKGVLWRRKYAREEQAACVIQKWFRSVSAMRAELKRFREIKKACLVIQSFWRGYKVRSKNSDLKVKKARERIQSANSEATEDNKLCNRTTSALDYLLHCRSQATVIEALKHLEVATRLSNICCERLTEDNALSVIFEIIKNCNRGLASIELIKVAICVVLNLVKCATTYRHVYEEEDSLELFVDLMNKYREKKTPIFCRSAAILQLLSRDSFIAMEIQKNKTIMKKLQSFNNLAGRKANMETKRNSSRGKSLKSKDNKENAYIFEQYASISRLFERLDKSVNR